MIELNKEEFIAMFEQFYDSEGYSQELMDEKNFFNFMKRANRDLTSGQRWIAVKIVVELIRGKEIKYEGDNNDK